MADCVVTTVKYSGPAAIVGALAQCIREQGAAAEFDPPAEQRSLGADAHVVLVFLACEGSKAAIRAGVDRFRASRLGLAAKVEIDVETEGDAN